MSQRNDDVLNIHMLGTTARGWECTVVLTVSGCHAVINDGLTAHTGPTRSSRAHAQADVSTMIRAFESIAKLAKEGRAAIAGTN